MKVPTKVQSLEAPGHRIRSVSARAWFAAMMFAVCFSGFSDGQGPISAVQDALKREHFYFGKSNGLLDEPTRDALRRFQARHGLEATGEVDSGTLQALQAFTAPSRPVVRSVVPASPTAEKDRAFLNELQKAEATGRETPPSLPVAASGPVPPQAETSLEPAPVRDATPVPAANTGESSPTANRLKPVGTKNRDRSGETSRSAAARKKSAAPREPATDAIARSRLEPEPVARGPDSAAHQTRGGRLSRSTTRTITPDGRTYIHEEQAASDARPPAPIIRRAVPVEPRRDKRGFFDRLFDGDD
jgi:hypothetical protein